MAVSFRTAWIIQTLSTSTSRHLYTTLIYSMWSRIGSQGWHFWPVAVNAILVADCRVNSAAGAGRGEVRRGQTMVHGLKAEPRKAIGKRGSGRLSIILLSWYNNHNSKRHGQAHGLIFTSHPFLIGHCMMQAWILNHKEQLAWILASRLYCIWY